jgi:hypothetical protein
MKEEIFKVKYEKYECIMHHDRTPLSYPRVNTFGVESTVSWLDEDEKPQRTPKQKKQRLVYIPKETHNSEEFYIENYGNPLAKVEKNYVMVVVEKQEHKVSLKLFWGYRERRVGNVWFKIGRNVEYVTVNTKTGDVYSGYLHNFIIFKRKERRPRK